jgi:hypothetical protein
MLCAGALLAFSFFTGCKQGNGDSCEVARDCESNFCSPGGGNPNSICCDPNNTKTCVVQTGVGGASGGVGGSTGTDADTSDTSADDSGTD